MTPFKERMNLYRAYRELNPDKNYWDWKASMYVQDNDWGYLEWKRNLPENLRYESPDYDLYGAYKSGMQPVLESDGVYHLGSRDPQTGRILKRKGHSTYLMAIDAEKAMGYDVYEGDDGYTYSQPRVPAMSTGGRNEEYIAQTDAIPSNDKYRQDVERELDLEKAVWLANHTDNNTGVISPHYNKIDDTYGTYQLPELIIKPEYKSRQQMERALNRAEGKRGEEYWRKGAQDATKFVGATVMAPLAVSMMSVPGIPMAMDLAGIFSGDASGLLSYLPLGKVSRLARALNKYDTPNLQMRLPIQTELIHTPSTSYPTGRTNLQLLERQSRLTSDELLGMPRHSRTHSITNQNYGRNFGEFDLRTNQHSTKILDDFIGEGSEHTVFQSRDPNFVYKVYTGASPKKEELRQFVERYSLRNNIDFAEPSIFKGYVTSKYGVHPVFKQKKLTPIAENAENRFELQNKIREMYKSAGWNDRMVKDGIQLNDMSVLNFAFDEFGNLRAIDVDVYPINGFKNGGVIPAMTDGGETTDLFIAQFGDAVTYGKDDTNLIGDISNWWNDLTGMKNYGYGYCAITPNGKLTTQCAKYSNDILRDQGYKNITGDAWNRAAHSNMKPITSGYTGLKKPKKYTEDAAHEYLQNAANNFAENVDTTLLITNDVIGIYYPDSPNTQKAFEGGQWGETQTHTGHTIVGKDGTHYVVHNVDGHLKINKLADMLTGKYDYLPVSAYRPRK